MAYRVFVSYSSADLSKVQTFDRTLRSAGAEVFTAEYSLLPSQNLTNDVIAAIKRCDLFVLLWSGNALASEWVSQEIGVAKGSQRSILPIVLQSGYKPSGFLRDIKYLKADTDPAKATEWLFQLIHGKVKQKNQIEGLTLLGIGIAIAGLLSSSDKVEI